MDILLALILSMSSNLDNIILGLTYGASNVQIPFKCSLIISCITTVVTVIFMVLGVTLGELLNAKVANVFGGMLLILIGFYFIIFEVLKKKNDSASIEQIITYKSMLLTATNLSVNNIPIAIAGGLSGTNILYTAIFSFVFSTLFMYIGNVAGRKFQSKMISAVAPILLVILGIIKCVQW